jgi:hypothetical protein
MGQDITDHIKQMIKINECAIGICIRYKRLVNLVQFDNINRDHIKQHSLYFGQDNLEEFSYSSYKS